MIVRCVYIGTSVSYTVKIFYLVSVGCMMLNKIHTLIHFCLALTFLAILIRQSITFL